MPSIGSRLQHAWSAFVNFNKDPPSNTYFTAGGSSYRPDRTRLSPGRERSIITSVYSRIALDAAAISIRHVRVDDEGRYVEDMKSSLNECLTLSANIDQTGRAFMQDVVMSMLDEGVVAIVPTDTDVSIIKNSGFDILSMRVGKITQWYPDAVRISVYNEKVGERQEITLPKTRVAIVENPLYAVMNEPNSTLQRLIRKLSLLDDIDEQSGANKLDLIIQLPYIVKTEARKAQAQARRKEIEDQLAGSKYGIAYTDGTEKITQINRPVENNLMGQIEYLTKMLYSQLGMTQQIFDGTADELTTVNYYNRTIEPILAAITIEMKRKFLTKTARTQKQSIMFFRNAFALASVIDIANVADTFTRNEILSSNDIRQLIGFKPSSEPRADELSNKNMPVEDRGNEDEFENAPSEEDITADTTEYQEHMEPAAVEPVQPTYQEPEPIVDTSYDTSYVEPSVSTTIPTSRYLIDPETGQYVLNPYLSNGG